ncbi:MAG: thioredoxin family protein [Candidatus Riflebacteria bacterium]|nr:thioredoxin family protein [Candidatus Riflebacteria bacterium]
MIDNDFLDKEIITKKRPALVAFTADWCRPCGLQKSVILSLAEKYRDEFIVETINAEAETSLSEKYNARTLPTTVVFSKGEVVEILPGFQSEEYLESYIKFILEKQQEEASKA